MTELFWEKLEMYNRIWLCKQKEEQQQAHKMEDRSEQVKQFC